MRMSDAHGLLRCVERVRMRCSQASDRGDGATPGGALGVPATARSLCRCGGGEPGVAAEGLVAGSGVEPDSRWLMRPGESPDRLRWAWRSLGARRLRRAGSEREGGLWAAG